MDTRITLSHGLNLGLKFLALFMVPGILILLLLHGCVTDPNNLEGIYGIQPGKEGHVPARIAIAPCQIWPPSSHFKDKHPSNAKDQEVKTLCDQYDEHILQMFDNQPFMKGLTPKFVEKSLTASGQHSLSLDLTAIWSQGGKSCSTCTNAPTYYTERIAPLPQWQTWLISLSRHVRNADALLLPFITYAGENHFNDRGLYVAERAASIAMLLVDTASGQLIWAGGREAFAPNKQLSADRHRIKIDPPPWEEVTARLYAESLWRDFPGRQTL